MLLQRKHNMCSVPYPSFPLINKSSIKDKVCMESVCAMQGRAPGTVCVWEEAMSGNSTIINHGTTWMTILQFAPT